MRKEDRKQIQGRASTTRSRVEMKATDFSIRLCEEFCHYTTGLLRLCFSPHMTLQ